tara:strand:+ start:912 stop:1424 length:513 start_codon:yes stop_codon:yes gene_type:complete
MVWPFKKKMTVDYLASTVADAIEENISVYYQAIKNHAVDNISDQAELRLNSELWAVELSVLDIVLPMTDVPVEMARQLIPMLIVGYSPLDKNNYLKRAKYYSSTVKEGPANEFAVRFSKAFVASSGITYERQRSGVNKEALEWAVGTVVVGSFQGLLDLISNISKKYRIY